MYYLVAIDPDLNFEHKTLKHFFQLLEKYAYFQYVYPLPPSRPMCVCGLDKKTPIQLISLFIREMF